MYGSKHEAHKSSKKLQKLTDTEKSTEERETPMMELEPGSPTGCIKQIK